MPRYDRYYRTSALESTPKTQRAIIADILLSADSPLSFNDIVAEAKRADYEGTFKQGRSSISIEDSISYQLEHMIKEGAVKKDSGLSRFEVQLFIEVEAEDGEAAYADVRTNYVVSHKGRGVAVPFVIGDNGIHELKDGESVIGGL